MKIGLLLFCLLTVHVGATAGIELKQMISWRVISDNPVNNAIKSNAVKVEFICKQQNDTKPFSNSTFVYSQNGGANQTVTTNANGTYAITTTPGKKKFVVFFTNEYTEIYTDSIVLKPSHHVVVELLFDRVEYQIICDKPVIYVYPEKATNVTVNIKPNGNLLFTYPAYNQGWSFWCEPNGTLTCNGKEYNYLFWEATALSPLNGANSTEGYCVATSDLVSFFENHLTQAGLNSKETADFITYWVPRMMGHEKHKIQFLFNAQVDACATLQVNPQPNNILRIFMVWTPLSEHENPILTPQSIPAFSRKGFTLVEWGGTQLPQSF